MEGPFTFINNKWQKTPLQRIKQSISEASDELESELKILSSINCEQERKNKSRNINDLQQTINTLKIEEKIRKLKDEELWLERDKLIYKISKSRYKNQQNAKIISNRKKMIDKVMKIDIELGPYRHRNKPFYLE